MSGQDDVGQPKALLGYCVCGRMTPAVPAAAFCRAAGNGSAKPWDLLIFVEIARG